MRQVDNKQDLDRELSGKQKVLVFFYASWCPYCTRFVPVFNKQIGDFNGAEVISVLLDDYDSPLWDDYDIEAVPTIILFEKSQVRSRLDGRFGVGLSEKQLVDWLKNLK